MNEASRWRHALAQQLAPHYSANPKVTAVSLGGSVSQGCADRFSDIDLTAFWKTPPTEKDRRAILKWVSGRRGPLFPYNAETGCWSEQFEMAGVTIDVRHMDVETTKRILADVLEHADPSLSKQQHLAALSSALPLTNPSLLTQWQQQAAAYPHELSVAMIREHLLFHPAWELEMLAERNEVLVLYDLFCTAQKHILLVLMGLNRIYYPGFQWTDRLIEQMHLVQPNLASRFKQVFGVASIDPLAGVYQLHELIEETFDLVETHLDEADIMQARERFRARRESWEHAPGGLM